MDEGEEKLKNYCLKFWIAILYYGFVSCIFLSERQNSFNEIFSFYEPRCYILNFNRDIN